MVIKVSEIPEEGIRLEGASAFPEPFQDRTWRLEDVQLAVDKDGDVVFAQVAPGNAASLRAFLAAGFSPIGSEVLFLTS